MAIATGCMITRLGVTKVLTCLTVPRVIVRDACTPVVHDYETGERKIIFPSDPSVRDVEIHWHIRTEDDWDNLHEVYAYTGPCDVHYAPVDYAIHGVLAQPGDRQSRYGLGRRGGAWDHVMRLHGVRHSVALPQAWEGDATGYEGDDAGDSTGTAAVKVVNQSTGETVWFSARECPWQWDSRLFTTRQPTADQRRLEYAMFVRSVDVYPDFTLPIYCATNQTAYKVETIVDWLEPVAIYPAWREDPTEVYYCVVLPDRQREYWAGHRVADHGQQLHLTCLGVRAIGGLGVSATWTLTTKTDWDGANETVPDPMQQEGTVAVAGPAGDDDPAGYLDVGPTLGTNLEEWVTGRCASHPVACGVGVHAGHMIGIFGTTLGHPPGMVARSWTDGLGWGNVVASGGWDYRAVSCYPAVTHCQTGVYLGGSGYMGGSPHTGGKLARFRWSGTAWEISYLIGGQGGCDAGRWVHSVRTYAGAVYVAGATVVAGISYPTLWRVSTGGDSIEELWRSSAGSANPGWTKLAGLVVHGGYLWAAEYIHRSELRIHRWSGSQMEERYEITALPNDDTWHDTIQRMPAACRDRVAWIGYHWLWTTDGGDTWTSLTPSSASSAMGGIDCDGYISRPYVSATNGGTRLWRRPNETWTAWEVPTDIGDYGYGGTACAYVAGLGWLAGGRAHAAGAATFYYITTAGGSGWRMILHDWGACADSTRLVVDDSITGGSVTYSLRTSDELEALSGDHIAWRVIELDGDGQAQYLFRGRYIQLRVAASNCDPGSMVDSVTVIATLHP